MQFGPPFGCSLPFYVKHFGESPPPERKTKRHRSLYTLDECARVLARYILCHVDRVDIEFRDDEEGDCTERSLRLYFSGVEMPIPSTSIKPAE